MDATKTANLYGEMTTGAKEKRCNCNFAPVVLNHCKKNLKTRTPEKPVKWGKIEDAKRNFKIFQIFLKKGVAFF